MPAENVRHLLQILGVPTPGHAQIDAPVAPGNKASIWFDVASKCPNHREIAIAFASSRGYARTRRTAQCVLYRVVRQLLQPKTAAVFYWTPNPAQNQRRYQTIRSQRAFKTDFTGFTS